MSLKRKPAPSLTRQSAPEQKKANPTFATDTRFRAIRETSPHLVSSNVIATAASEKHPVKLSGRALNVLKLLAPEFTEEIPPRGPWIPSAALLRKITMKHLSLARNCGPQTADEIANWAASRGVTIQPVFQGGRSLSAMWRNLEEKFAAGKLTNIELREALEKSVRRKSTKIPLALQVILLSLLSSSCD
ncbi:hypothetical protein BH10PSE11_BH10PSE11_02000 [soil metagenome]